MDFTFYSRKLKRDITFSTNGTNYIFIDLNGQPGTLGNQICSGGSLGGSTLMYTGDDFERFEWICKNWWKAYLRHQREVPNICKSGI